MARRTAAGRGLRGVGVVAALAACAAVDPPPCAVSVPFRASLEGSGAVALALVVDVPGVPVAQRTEWPARGGHVAGVVPLEPGRGRVVSVRAHDAHGLVTHAGGRRVDVRDDGRTAFTLVLEPRGARPRIEVAFGPAEVDAVARAAR